MSVFDIIPLSVTSMSVYTAIVLFFYAIIAGMGFRYMAMELKDINDKVIEHTAKILTCTEDRVIIKRDIALILQTVTRMDKKLDQQEETQNRLWQERNP